MQKINLRVWDSCSHTMFYINNFLYKDKFVRFIDEGKEYISDNYMQMTNGIAMNGEIYENDIIVDIFDKKIYLVVFDEEDGNYKGINGENFISIKKQMFDYEIIGNEIENPDLLSEINTLNVTNYSNPNYSNVVDERCNLDTLTMDMIDIDSNVLAMGNTQEEFYATGQELIIDDINDDLVDVMNKKQEEQENKFICPQMISEDNTVSIYVGNAKNLRGKQCSFSYLIEGAGYNICNSGILNKIKDIRKAELETIIYSLCLIKTPRKIKVFSSSSYVTFPFIQGWIEKWKNNNWRKEKTNVKIKDAYFFEKLYELTKIHDIKFIFDDTNPVVLNCQAEAEQVINCL